MLISGASPEEIASTLTEMAIPTGGRRRDGTLNTHWSPWQVMAVARNEKHCGDVLARKTYTPNYKDHKAKKNNGKKNKYFQPDHHEAIVSRAVWNAAQRILNSRRYGHEGTYLPMRIIERGALTGYISMNLTWAGFDCEDYYRASQIAMGLLDDELEVDLGSEYLPEAGRRIGGLVDDHGIAQIARDLTAAEQQIKDELEGRAADRDDGPDRENAAQIFQVVSGDMFSRVHEPVAHITRNGMTFNNLCVSKLPGAEAVELLYNPVERMLILRPCSPDHPNAIPWDSRYKPAGPVCRALFDSMGWETDYSYRVQCHTLSLPGTEDPSNTVLLFDLDNYIGRSDSRRDEAIIPNNIAGAADGDREDAKSYYYPPDEDEPRAIMEMEEKFRQAVELNKKLFGTPVFRHDPGLRGFSADITESDLQAEARPLGKAPRVDADAVDKLLESITNDPPVLPYRPGPFPEHINADNENEEVRA